MGEELAYYVDPENISVNSLVTVKVVRKRWRIVRYHGEYKRMTINIRYIEDLEKDTGNRKYLGEELAYYVDLVKI